MLPARVNFLLQLPLLRTRPMLLAAVVAGLVALVACDLPWKLGLMLAALCGVSAGVLAERWSAAASVREVGNESV